MTSLPAGSAASRAERLPTSLPAYDRASAASSLVGRGEEVTRLCGLVTGLLVGQGRSVWIEGEPGIGKSALLAAGLAEARRLGCRSYAAQADESGALFPLRVLFDALEIGPCARDADRAQLFALLTGRGRGAFGMAGTNDTAMKAGAAEMLLVMVERLCAADPVVLAVDDLQWADDMSLAVWSRLHRAAARFPLLLIAAARPVPQRTEMDRLRRTVVIGKAVMLRPQPLNTTQASRLVARLAGAAPGPRLLHAARKAGGNPLYLTELVDVLVRDGAIRVEAGVAEVEADGEAPPTLAAAITARLGFLSTPARDVLRLAALLGVGFSVDHLRMLSGRAATELVGVVAEAVSAGVVAESGASLTFRHPLIREALYQAMPTGLRAALHRQAARALAEGGAPAEQVAHQLLQAPETADPWAVEWLTAAAPALTHSAPQVAHDLLRRILATVDPGDARHDELDTHLVSALFLLGQDDKIAALARPVLARARDPVTAGRMAWTLAYALLRTAQDRQAEAVTVAALRQPALSPVWAARLRAVHALILVNSGRYEEARTAGMQAEADGRQAGDWLAVGYALHVLSMAHFRQCKYPASLDMLDRALATIGEQPETADLRLLLLGNRSEVLGGLGRAAEAGHAAAQALSLAERVGTPLRQAISRVQVAELYVKLGRWDDATVQLGLAAGVALDAARWPGLRGLAALIAVHRDDHDAARRNLEDAEVRSHVPGDGRYDLVYQRVARALAAERDNRPEQALRLLLEVLLLADPSQVGAVHTDRPLWLPDVVRLALSAGDSASARAAAAACADAARQHPLPHIQAAARHCTSLLDGSPGDLRAAAGMYASAGYPLYQAHALENAAVLAARQGDDKAARVDYAQAVRIYTGLRAAWDLRRADVRLRSLGIRRGVRGSRRRPGAGWHSLTPTELTIANLVATGHSTLDIASELYMARRTVQIHISHILGKLGARSRVEIAQYAFGSASAAEHDTNVRTGQR